MSVFERSVSETVVLVLEFLRKLECQFAVCRLTEGVLADALLLACIVSSTLALWLFVVENFVNLFFPRPARCCLCVSHFILHTA
jgi:hypothetical protein